MDGLTLVLDAAASTGTIAVLRAGAVIAERSVEMRSNAEEKFLPAVVGALDAVGASPRTVSRIICGAGPGSFTSLRVVGAVAKGLAHGGGLPLFAVPSLALIVAGDARTVTPDSRWLATLDAMRDERYVALVTIGAGGELAAVESLGLCARAEIGARAESLDATIIGPDETLSAGPHARGAARCLGLISAAGPVNLASWEPVYGRLAEAQVKWEAAQGRPLR